MDTESVCFLGGSTLKAESKYDAESITSWKCLQRATRYVEMGVYINIKGKTLRKMGPKCRWTLKMYIFLVVPL